jgi:hypothetical protein
MTAWPRMNLWGMLLAQRHRWAGCFGFEAIGVILAYNATPPRRAGIGGRKPDRQSVPLMNR